MFKNAAILVWLLLAFGTAARAYTSMRPQDKPHFSYDDLMQSISSLREKKIENLLAILPSDYKSAYAIMLHSRSLQEAEPGNPRILIYGRDAKLIITFNGHPKQRGFETLETMRYDESDGKPKFIFEEIVFEEDRKARELFLTTRGDLEEIEEMNDRSDRVGPNPEACLSCHRTDPRPNWSPYRLWADAFAPADIIVAKVDGVLTRSFYDSKAFVDSAKDHPRYGQLPQAANLLDGYLNPSDRFFDNCLTDPSIQNCDLIMLNQDLPKYAGGGFNESITRLLEILNKRRIVHRIASHSEFQSFKKAIMGSLVGCTLDQTLSLLPPEAQKDLSIEEGTRFVDRIKEFQRMGRQDEIDRLLEFMGTDGLPSGPKIREELHRLNRGDEDDTLAQNLGQTFYLLEKGMNLNTYSFTMTFYPDTYLFSNGAFGSIADELRERLGIAWPPWEGKFIPCDPKLLNQIK